MSSLKVPPKVNDHKSALLDIILKMKAREKNTVDSYDTSFQDRVQEQKDHNQNDGEEIEETENENENDENEKEEKELDKNKNKNNKNADENQMRESNNENENDEFEETDLSISTITATGSVGCTINMASFYYNTVIDDICDDSIKRDGFTYIEWGQKGAETLCRGLHKKMTIKHKRIKEGKRFDKQITVILRKYDTEHDTYLYQNLKVFYNGMIQMTGLKSCEQGEWVLQYVIDTLKKIKKEKCRDIFDDDLGFFGEHALIPHDYNIRLINSNFRLGYAVNRRVLCNFLNLNNIYNVFEASRYPGVKIPFYWNARKERQDGICSCVDQICTKTTKTEKRTDKRDNKRDKDKDVDIFQTNSDESPMCHKTTIIVFQSGSIIITGGQSMKQIYDSYDFIKTIFDRIGGVVKKPFTRIKYSKTYPKFSYNDMNEKKKKAIKLPQGYKYDVQLDGGTNTNTNENKNDHANLLCMR